MEELNAAIETRQPNAWMRERESNEQEKLDALINSDTIPDYLPRMAKEIRWSRSSATTRRGDNFAPRSWRCMA